MYLGATAVLYPTIRRLRRLANTNETKRRKKGMQPQPTSTCSAAFNLNTPAQELAAEAASLYSDAKPPQTQHTSRELRSSTKFPKVELLTSAGTTASSSGRYTCSCPSSRASFSPATAALHLRGNIADREARKRAPHGRRTSTEFSEESVTQRTITTRNDFSGPRQRDMSAQGTARSHTSDARCSILHTRREAQTKRLSRLGPTNAPTYRPKTWLAGETRGSTDVLHNYPTSLSRLRETRVHQCSNHVKQKLCVVT